MLGQQEHTPGVVLVVLDGLQAPAQSQQGIVDVA